MKTILKWFAAKYAVSIVNDALSKANEKTDVAKICSRISKIVQFLNSLAEKVSDGKIEQDEADEIVEEVKRLF